FEVSLQDGTHELKLKWFHFPAGYLEEKIKRDQKLIVCGKVRQYRSKFEMHHPDFEVYSGGVDSISFGRVVPVYREIGGLYQKQLRKILNYTVTHFSQERICGIPNSICQKEDLLSPHSAVREIHLPSTLPNPEERSVAQKSLAFEELF